VLGSQQIEHSYPDFFIKKITTVIAVNNAMALPPFAS